MHIIEILIHRYLSEINQGNVKVDEQVLNKFALSCKESLKRQIEDRNREFTIRASNIGRPLCMLQYEQLGIPGDTIGTDIIRNLYGDITERIVVFILEAAGVPITSYQEQVQLDIADTTISGTLDLIIDFGDDPRVWDIKSASEWSFKNKFDKSFEEIIKYDNFGYGEQLCFYATAKRCKIGGLIVFNKSSGEIRVIPMAEEQQLLRDTLLRDIEAKIVKLRSYNKVVDAAAATKPNRCFDPIPELWYGKPTGNKSLGVICQFCPWKFKCWQSLSVEPNRNSKAKNPALVYYIDGENE